MDCISTQDRMVSFLLEELPGRERELVELHCRSCRACQEEETRLGRALGVLYRLPEWSTSGERRELALERVRMIMRARGWTFPPPSSLRGGRLALVLGVAAALLLGAFLALRFLSVAPGAFPVPGSPETGGTPTATPGSGTPGVPAAPAAPPSALPGAVREPTLLELCERGLIWARQQENWSRWSPEEKKASEQEGAEVARLLFSRPGFYPELGKRLLQVEAASRGDVLALLRLLAAALETGEQTLSAAERETLVVPLARKESRPPFSPEVRVQAFTLLARLGREQAFPLLLDAYKGETHARVSWELLGLLERAITPEESVRLVELLRFERASLLRYRLLDIISRHPPPEGWVALHEFLRHEDFACRLQVLGLLWRCEGKEMAQELPGLYREEVEMEGRRVIVSCLFAAGTAKDRQLLWEIGATDPSPDVRAESWRLLYGEQPKAVTDLLEKIFKQGTEEERAAALLAAGQCGLEAGEKPLLEALRTGGRGRQYALRALASLEKPWVAATLEEILRGGDREERVLAAVALGRKGRNLATLAADDEIKIGAVRYLEQQVLSFDLLSPGLGEVAAELSKKYGVETRWRSEALRDELASWRFVGGFKGQFPVSFVLRAMARVADLKLGIGPGYLEWTRESGERGPTTAAR